MPEEDDMSKLVGAKIRKLRTSRGLTLQQLSDMIGDDGISGQMIGQLETNVRRLNLEHLQKISKALNVDMTYFFEESPVLNYIYQSLADLVDIRIVEEPTSVMPSAVRTRGAVRTGGIEASPVNHEYGMESDTAFEIAKRIIDKEILALMIKAKSILTPENLERLRKEIGDRIDYFSYLQSHK